MSHLNSGLRLAGTVALTRHWTVSLRAEPNIDPEPTETTYMVPNEPSFLPFFNVRFPSFRIRFAAGQNLIDKYQ
jgi:hypothetical protein